MQITNLQPQRMKQVFSLTYADLVALGANATGNITLVNPFPNGSKVVGYEIKGRTQFVWGGGGTGTVKVQLATILSDTTNNTIGNQSGDLIATAVTDKAPITEGAVYNSGQDTATAAGSQLVLNVASSNSNLNLLSAGAVDVMVEWELEMATFPYQAFNPNN